MFESAGSLPSQMVALLHDEAHQNDLLPADIRRQLNERSYVGQDTEGEFGRDLANPIPVNGQIGELIYLSLLSRNGRPIAFHYLGSAGRLDVFEAVCVDGSAWDLLCLDAWHARKSRIAPMGYDQLGAIPNSPFVSGLSSYCETFPYGLYDLVAEQTKSLFGVSLASDWLRKIADTRRTARHEALLGKLAEANALRAAAR